MEVDIIIPKKFYSLKIQSRSTTDFTTNSPNNFFFFLVFSNYHVYKIKTYVSIRMVTFLPNQKVFFMKKITNMLKKKNIIVKLTDQIIDFSPQSESKLYKFDLSIIH